MQMKLLPSQRPTLQGIQPLGVGGGQTPGDPVLLHLSPMVATGTWGSRKVVDLVWVRRALVEECRSPNFSPRMCLPNQATPL